jgi:hypothetical protein
MNQNEIRSPEKGYTQNGARALWALLRPRPASGNSVIRRAIWRDATERSCQFFFVGIHHSYQHVTFLPSLNHTVIHASRV